MSGIRLVIGILVMAIGVPITLFLVLDLHTPSNFLAIAATTFCAWGIAEVLAKILERPRLRDRSPGKAMKEDWERRVE